MEKKLGKCENCAKRATCKKEIGFMFGGCRISYKPIKKLISSARCEARQ